MKAETQTLFDMCDHNVGTYLSVMKNKIRELVECAPHAFPDIPWNDCYMVAEMRKEQAKAVRAVILTYYEFIEEYEIIGEEYVVKYGRNQELIDNVKLIKNSDGTYKELHRILTSERKIQNILYKEWNDENFEINKEMTSIDYCGHIFVESKDDKIMDEMFGHPSLKTHYQDVIDELLAVEPLDGFSKKETIIMVIDKMISLCLIADDGTIAVPDWCNYNVKASKGNTADINVLEEHLKRLLSKLRSLYNKVGTGKVVIPHQINTCLRLKILADKLRIYGEMCSYYEELDDRLVCLKRYSTRVAELTYLIAMSNYIMEGFDYGLVLSSFDTVTKKRVYE